jgi:MerR family Zn(II)-responsive transcriptional regulator of zntA
MGNAYRIGEVAERAGITVDTLRYYEKLGVLPRARRTSSGLRQYGEEVLKQVRFIQEAQALGLTLSDVRQLVGDQGRVGRDRCRKVRDLLSARLEDVDTKLAQLRSFRQTLQAHLDACEEALAQQRPACPVISELTQ